MFARKRRCYNCGLDYMRRDNAVCPRCGETRTIKRSSPFNDNPGILWKTAIGSGNMAAGHAAADLRKQGTDDLWRAENPERD